MRQLFVKRFSQGEKVFGNFTAMEVKLAAWEQNLAFGTGRRRDRCGVSTKGFECKKI